MIVQGDTPIRVVITCNMKGHSRPCSDEVVEAYLMDAHLQVSAVMHGKVSGMDSGVRVRYRATLVEV